MKTHRTILHGSCLVGGRHEPGSQLANECPLLRAEKRRAIGHQGVDGASPSSGVMEALSGDDLESEFRDGGNASDLPLARGRRRVGRPASTEPSRHARYRRRHADYRAREASRKSKKRLAQKPMGSVTPVASVSFSPNERGRRVSRRRGAPPRSSWRRTPSLQRLPP